MQPGGDIGLARDSAGVVTDAKRVSSQKSSQDTDAELDRRHLLARTSGDICPPKVPKNVMPEIPRVIYDIATRSVPCLREPHRPSYVPCLALGIGPGKSALAPKHDSAGGTDRPAPDSGRSTDSHRGEKPLVVILRIFALAGGHLLGIIPRLSLGTDVALVYEVP